MVRRLRYASKQLVGQYQELAGRFEAFTKPGNASDFKANHRVALSAMSSLEYKPEGGSIQFSPLTEASSSFALATYGGGIVVTRELLINDDLGALSQWARMAGLSAARTVADLVFSVFSNPTSDGQVMSDGNPLFDASGHANTDTSADLDVDAVAAAQLKMLNQTGLKGEPLDISPAFILVPNEYLYTAETIVSATTRFLSTAQENAPTKSISQLQVIASARVPADDVILVADPSVTDTIEVCYLDGNRSPMVAYQEDFETMSIKLRATIDAAAHAVDWRGFSRIQITGGGE